MVASLFSHSAVVAIGVTQGEAVDDDTCWREIAYEGKSAYLNCSWFTPIEPCSRRAQSPTDAREAYPDLTCGEIYERFGEANFTRDHPAYSARRDGDGDGIACER